MTISDWAGKLLLMLLCGAWPIGGLADDTALFYALDADFEALKKAADGPARVSQAAGRSSARLQFGAQTVHAIKMGSGAVETALSAQALLTRVRCDRAFSIGPVGALTEESAPGSWRRVSEIVAYQHGSWLTSGFQRGKDAAMTLDANAIRDLTLPEAWKEAAPLRVASGEMFIASASQRTKLAAETGAQCVDMNLFGLARACADHRLPLVCWRIVSDRADDRAGEDFKAFTAQYDGSGGRWLAETIRKLPLNPNSATSYPALRELIAPPDEKPQ